MQIDYRQHALDGANLAGLKSERRALLDELARAQEAHYVNWDPYQKDASPGLQRLRERLADVETDIRKVQAAQLKRDARLAYRQAWGNVARKALRVAPLLVGSLMLLFATVALDGCVGERESRAAVPAATAASAASAAAAEPAGPAQLADGRSSEVQEALARVQCIEGLMQGHATRLTVGCAQAAVTVSVRGPAVGARAEQLALKADREVVSEWRFPSAIELRQAAALAAALKAVEKDERRSALQKMWAALVVPLQVVGVFGVLLAAALLTAELARVAGFHWRVEKFMGERLASKDAGSEGGKAAPGASAGTALAALLGALPLLLMVLLLVAMVGLSSWRTLAPRDSLQSIVDRTVVHTPVLPQAASAPIHVTVSSPQIDDNFQVLARQLALLTQANEQSRQAALSSAGWLKNVEQGAAAAQRPLQAAASAAQSLGGALQKVGDAAHQTQQAASAIGGEARQAAEFYTQAARKMDESAGATLKRIQADEKNLADTKVTFNKAINRLEQTKWGHGAPNDGRP